MKMIKSMVIIADDLTGANDTGVQFARQGLTTEVLLEGSAVNNASQAAVVVADTNSRADTPQAAYQKVQQIARQAGQAGFGHYYKKLDSTLRGNIGSELQAILDLDVHDFALVMPAFPKNGRTTVGSLHLLNGIPVACTEIARDPKCPVFESQLPQLLRQQTGCNVGHIGIAELTQGEAAIISALRHHLAGGCRIISSDAWLDEHFLLVAKAAAKVSSRILWSGSAGLAEFLPRLLGWQKEQNHTQPVLAIAGSVSAVTRGQVKQLLSAGFEFIEWEAANDLHWQDGQELPCTKQALELLQQGKNLVITSGYLPEGVERAVTAGAKLGISPLEVSNFIAKMLGRIGATLLEQQDLAGAILTGGDTAVAVCRALGVTGIRICEEIAPAIPLGEMKTTTGKIIRVVTKAGAFGDSEALLKAAQRLQQRRSACE